MRTVSTALLAAVFMGPPFAAIIANRFDPSIGSALGVPYAFLLGLLLGLVATIAVLLASKRWPQIKPYYLIVTAVGLVTGLLFFVAEQGMLSVVN